MKVCVSIDGGGIRGVLPLIIMREIENRISRPFYSKVDMCVGSSTGAIINAVLSLRKEGKQVYSIQEVIDMYEFKSHKAFNPETKNLPERYVYKLLDKTFENFRFEQTNGLHILTATRRGFLPMLFSEDSPVKIQEALKASCAIPPIFPSYHIKGIDYVDGMFADKNPSLHILPKIISEPVLFLSFGTGVLSADDKIERRVEEVHKSMIEWSKAASDRLYFRINPPLISASESIQNTTPSNIFRLKKDAQIYWRKNQKMFNQIIHIMKIIE